MHPARLMLPLLIVAQLSLGGCHTEVYKSTNQSSYDYEARRLRAYRCGDSLFEVIGQEKKSAALDCLKAALGPDGDQSTYASYLYDLQRMGQWETAWETDLPRDPEARLIVQNLCSKEAKEVIYETAEGISSAFFDIDGEHAFEDIYIETDSMGGIGLSKFWYRLAPLAVEADAQRFGDPKINSQGLPIMMVKNFENPVYRKQRSSAISIVFKRATGPDQESKGVYGRTISVIDSRNNKLLGERTEFFWMWPPNFRSGIRQRFAICPTVGSKQSTPSYFIRKVINPITIPCLREFAEDHAKMQEDHRRETNAISTETLTKYRMLEKAIDEKSHVCNNASKAALPPLPE